jgi:hypothetical protein
MDQFCETVVGCYGIYAAADCPSTDEELCRWAQRNGVAANLTQPESPRVLFCLGPRERFERKLALEPGLKSTPTAVAARFQTAVLIHEHFHAIVETGHGSQPTFFNKPSFRQALKEASRLNESLAVWMELHYARDDEDLRGIVLRYMSAGHYPHWPYAGAAEIEAQYQERGVEVVREWIERLRNDPVGAVSAFDLAVGNRANVASAS